MLEKALPYFLESVTGYAKEKKQRKEEIERQAETSMLKMITFIVTLAAMALGMSYLPLFSATSAYSVGCFGCVCHLSKTTFRYAYWGSFTWNRFALPTIKIILYFFLGDTPVRIAFIIVWMGLFVVLPLMFKRYKSALAINFGIFAFVSLF